jgi:hypothetical protein
MTVTEKGMIILYGGVTTNTVLSRLFKNQTLYSDLWSFNLIESNADFNLINIKTAGGGFSRIVLLEKGLICILNKNFKDQMIILDTEQLKIIGFTDKNTDDHVALRNAFGVVSIGNIVVIMGGYVEKSGHAYEIEGNSIIYAVALNKILKLQEEIINLRYLLFIISIIPFGFAFFTFFKRKNGSLVKEENMNTISIVVPSPEKKSSKDTSTLSTTNSSTKHDPTVLVSHFTDSVMEVTKNILIPPAVNTSANGLQTTKHIYTSLAIPLFLKGGFNIDYLIEQELSVGGFGVVYIGILLNEEFVKGRNNGDHSCVIKTMNEVDEEMFFQELSIYERFKREKYFSKLICYSDTSHHIVMRYYKYGSLFHFIFSKTLENLPIPYELQSCLHLAEKTAYAIGIMHQKGYIHNDIKSTNVLLDGDDEEPLFPVITDFGISHILDSAIIACGFKRKNVKAGTLEYCAPEVLTSFKNNELISDVKTDVYSLGIVFLELFTRNKAWKIHKVETVLQGGFPDISVKKFLDNFHDITKSIAVNLVRLVLWCIEFDPEKRPRMMDVRAKLILLKDEVLLVKN